MIKIVNDITTLNGALTELGETIATNISAKGVTASASDGLTTLAEKILDIEQGQGQGQNIVTYEPITTSFNYTRLHGNNGFTVNIPNGVVSIDAYCFYYCFGLKDVTIPSSVTSIGNNAFNSCSALASITIPSSVTSIGSSAFAYCTSLASVTVEATTPPTSGIGLFTNDHANLVIYVPSVSLNAYKSASGWSAYASRIQAIPST